MFDIQFSGLDAFDRAADEVRQVRERLVDLRGLGEDVRSALREGFARMLAEGVDKDGNKLAPLAESTIKRRGHGDQPLRPDGKNPLLDSLTVEVARTRGGEIRVSAWFAHPAAKFLAEGTKNMPARNAMTPDAKTLEAIQGLIDDHVSGSLEGRLIARF